VSAQPVDARFIFPYYLFYRHKIYVYYVQLVFVYSIFHMAPIGADAGGWGSIPTFIAALLVLLFLGDYSPANIKFLGSLRSP
jgi:hypothetical protein